MGILPLELHVGKKSMNTCSNCQKPLQPDSRYCSNCGQAAGEFQRPFREACKKMMHELLDIDGRLVLTLRTLLFEPGKLTVEFNQGMRAKYTPPLRMYLVISIIFFLLFTLIEKHILASHSGLTSITEQYPRIMFALLPAFAGLLQIFYWKTYFVSNLIFALHIHSFSYIMLLLILPLENAADTNWIFLVIQLLLTGYLVWYLFVALKRNYQQNWPITLIKLFLICSFYLGLVLGSFEYVQHSLADDEPDIAITGLEVFTGDTSL